MEEAVQIQKPKEKLEYGSDSWWDQQHRLLDKQTSERNALVKVNRDHRDDKKKIIKSFFMDNKEELNRMRELYIKIFTDSSAMIEMFVRSYSITMQMCGEFHGKKPEISDMLKESLLDVSKSIPIDKLKECIQEKDSTIFGCVKLIQINKKLTSEQKETMIQFILGICSRTVITQSGRYVSMEDEERPEEGHVWETGRGE